MLNVLPDAGSDCSNTHKVYQMFFTWFHLFKPPPQTEGRVVVVAPGNDLRGVGGMQGGRSWS